MRISQVFTLLFGVLAGASSAQSYQLSKNFSGPSFFDHFTFFSDADPTHGTGKYVSMQAANSSGLAGFAQGSDFSGLTYLGIDTSGAATNGRSTTRIQSIDTFGPSLHVADILHMPTGCGTWPAYWLVGPNWPAGGEIDVVEGVNTQTVNRMTLHTADHLIMANISDAKAANASGMSMTGDFISLDCSTAANGNQGCAADGGVYGEDLNNIGGVVMATEFTPDFISIWNFPRSAVPADALSDTPNPRKWPNPDAHFMLANGTALGSAFSNLQIVVNTALCGDWAGAADVWSSSDCSKLAPTCQQYVANNAAAFKNAFWLFKGISVFTPTGNGSTNSTTSAPTNSTSSAMLMPTAYRHKARRTREYWS